MSFSSFLHQNNNKIIISFHLNVSIMSELLLSSKLDENKPCKDEITVGLQFKYTYSDKLAHKRFTQPNTKFPLRSSEIQTDFHPHSKPLEKIIIIWVKNKKICWFLYSAFHSLSQCAFQPMEDFEVNSIELLDI